MYKKISLIIVVLLLGLNIQILSSDSTYIFPSEKNICVKLLSNTKLIDSQYVYEYQIKSLECSEQPIWEFRLVKKTLNVDVSSPLNWSHMNSNLKYITIGWGASDTADFINKNENLSGYKVISAGLPSICKCFISGYVPLPVFSIGEEPIVVLNNDIFENSWEGQTIAPKDISSVLVLNDFLDTLTTYTDSSYALGWIETEEAKNKYNTYFNSAKMYLQQTDTASAKAELELVLNECDVDSSTVLTSEAYALLYFNTEYLIEQLPDTDPLPVELTMFVGEVVDTTVVLHWQTVTEINNYGFSVEQNSILFPDWKEIGFVEGHGNSYSPKEYTYTDSLVTTTSNYRLKIIDTNGGYKYSKTITVIIE